MKISNIDKILDDTKILYKILIIDFQTVEFLQQSKVTWAYSIK